MDMTLISKNYIYNLKEDIIKSNDIFCDDLIINYLQIKVGDCGEVLFTLTTTEIYIKCYTLTLDS